MIRLAGPEKPSRKPTSQRETANVSRSSFEQVCAVSLVRRLPPTKGS